MSAGFIKSKSAAILPSKILYLQGQARWAASFFFSIYFLEVKKTTAGLASKILSGYWMLRFQFISVIVLSTISKTCVYDLLHNESGGFYTVYHGRIQQCRQKMAS